MQKICYQKFTRITKMKKCYKKYVIKIGCKNLVKTYAAEFCINKFNAKTLTKIVGIEQNV